MEPYYWMAVVVIECVVVYFGLQWVSEAIKETHSSLQAGAAVIYCLGVAMVMIGIAAFAYFIAVDFLHMAPPITKKIVS